MRNSEWQIRQQSSIRGTCPGNLWDEGSGQAADITYLQSEEHMYFRVRFVTVITTQRK